MNWFAAIDIYCERLDPSFFAEPFNLWSNAGFILVAVWGWMTAQQKQLDQFVSIRVLVALAFAIGTGSFLFHGFANKWSQLADILPIAIYILSYLVLVLKHLFHFNMKQITLTLVSFFSLSFLITLVIPNKLVNGSSSYFGVAFTMLWLFWLSRHKRMAVSRDFLIMAILFLISLTFRSIDMMFCDALALGTHFLWHIGNALVIGASLKIIFKSFAERTSP